MREKERREKTMSHPGHGFIETDAAFMIDEER